MDEFWVDIAKKRLDNLYETAKIADSEVTNHLRSIVNHLLQKLLIFNKQYLEGGLIGFFEDVSTSIINAFILKNVNAKTFEEKRLEKTEIKDQKERQLRNIIRRIPSMSVNELHLMLSYFM